MRSHLFGFHVETQFRAEIMLLCPLQQAYETMRQHVYRLGWHTSWLNGQYVPVGAGKATYTVGFEAYLKMWSEEVHNAVSDVLLLRDRDDELERMHAIKQALSWIWPNLRETATMAQYLLSATIDGETHMSLEIGWNTAADLRDAIFAVNINRDYLYYLERLKIPIRLLTPLPASNWPASNGPASKRHYGPRPETVEKIRALVALRADHMRNGEVSISRTRACEMVGITPSVVKKHRPQLHERWYDLDYDDPG